MTSRRTKAGASGNMADPLCLGGGFCSACWEHWLFFGRMPTEPVPCPRCKDPLGTVYSLAEPRAAPAQPKEPR